MVTKCANPDCSTPFRYFRSGKLFVLREAGQGRKIDYYWLCDKCSQILTVERDARGGIAVAIRTAHPARSEQNRACYQSA
jgi:hypothetical protein